MIDGIVQFNLRFDTHEQVDYRIADAARAVVHDLIHGLQYKLFSRTSARLKEKKEKTESDALIQQYGMSLSGVDQGWKWDETVQPKFSLSASLFEYVTDRFAQEMVRNFFHLSGRSWPRPKSPFEEILTKDLNGEVVHAKERDTLVDSREKAIADLMVKFGTDILLPARHALGLFGYGPLRREVEKALQEATLTGKFRHMKDIGDRLIASNFMVEGQRLDAKRIFEAAAVCGFFRAMFGAKFNERQKRFTS